MLVLLQRVDQSSQKIGVSRIGKIRMMLFSCYDWYGSEIRVERAAELQKQNFSGFY